MNPRLARQTGVILAMAEALKEASGALTDTDDMITYRKFQLELGEFVRTHQFAGNLPDNPLAYLSGLADGIEKALSDIEAFAKEKLELGRPILTKERGSMSKASLDETAAKVEEALSTLVAREHDFAAMFDPLDLLKTAEGYEVAAELLTFCRLRSPNARMLRTTTNSFCQFTHGEGPVHADVVLHLQAVAAACEEMLAEHARHQAVLQQARALAEAGDYARAAKLFAELNPLFRDLQYEAFSEVVDKWSGRLREMQSKFDAVKATCLVPWHAPFARPWKVADREREMKVALENLQGTLTTFHGGLDKWPNSDFEKDGRQLVKRLSDELRGLREHVAAGIARARRMAMLQLVITLGALAVAAHYWETSWPIVAVAAAAWAFSRVWRRMHAGLEGRTRIEFKIEVNGRTVEDPALAQICLNGEPFSSGAVVKPGVYRLSLHSKSFEPVDLSATVELGKTNNLGVIKAKMHQQAYTNSLGMPFVPVGGTSVMFCVWPTRAQDYILFCAETKRQWTATNFKQEPNHPAVNVTWHDASEFCQWLTAKERASYIIGPNDTYRLPSDVEWSTAVGLRAEPGSCPQERDGKNSDKFPWGTQWPPPKGAGNYDPQLNVDNFANTSPVGSFAANDQGLFDLGGNVWEWVHDNFAPKDTNRTLRGGSWCTSLRKQMLSSARLFDSPGHRINFIGFRCALDVRRPSPLLSTAGKADATAPQQPQVTAVVAKPF